MRKISKKNSFTKLGVLSATLVAPIFVVVSCSSNNRTGSDKDSENKNIPLIQPYVGKHVDDNQVENNSAVTANTLEQTNLVANNNSTSQVQKTNEPMSVVQPHNNSITQPSNNTNNYQSVYNNPIQQATSNTTTIKENTNQTVSANNNVVVSSHTPQNNYQVAQVNKPVQTNLVANNNWTPQVQKTNEPMSIVQPYANSITQPSNNTNNYQSVYNNPIQQPTSNIITISPGNTNQTVSANNNVVVTPQNNQQTSTQPRQKTNEELAAEYMLQHNGQIPGLQPNIMTNQQVSTNNPPLTQQEKDIIKRWDRQYVSTHPDMINHLVDLKNRNDVFSDTPFNEIFIDEIFSCIVGKIFFGKGRRFTNQAINTTLWSFQQQHTTFIVDQFYANAMSWIANNNLLNDIVGLDNKLKSMETLKQRPAEAIAFLNSIGWENYVIRMFQDKIGEPMYGIVPPGLEKLPV